jgi:hypothetical protein
VQLLGIQALHGLELVAHARRIGLSALQSTSCSHPQGVGIGLRSCARRGELRHQRFRCHSAVCLLALRYCLCRHQLLHCRGLLRLRLLSQPHQLHRGGSTLGPLPL